MLAPRRFLSRSFFCLLLLLTACSPLLPPQTTSVIAPSPSAAIQEAPSPTPLPLPPTAEPTSTATPDPASLPAPQYTLSASLNYAAHSVSVLEQIVYTNRSGQPIPDLLLVADAQEFPNVFNLKSISASSGPALVNPTWDKTWLQAGLERPLQPGEALTLDASFELSLPARVADAALRPMVFGWSQRQTNLVDWYLYLPPYQSGQGWLAHRPGYYGEHQVFEASDFIVNLQVSAAPDELVSAGPAPEQTSGDWKQYRLKAARTFAFSFSPEYQVMRQTAGAVSITSYYWPYHTLAGQAALQTAAQAVELYARLFGGYPYESLAVVEADFLDGMEYDGLFFLSNGFYNLYDGSPGSYLVALTAHETAHQWWFGAVGDDQALEPWLDEALATYCEKLYLQTYAPSAVDWWLQVRVMYYQPHGYVDDSIYNPHKDAQPYRAYRDAVYLNGALFLDELRAQVGDDAFFAFLQDYAGRYRGKIATGKDFFAVMQAHSSADLSGLQKKYFNPAQ